MLADFLTKPLQGALFKKFRAVILGTAHISTLGRVPHLAMERVEKKDHVEAVPTQSRVTWADVVKNKPIGKRMG